MKLLQQLVIGMAAGGCLSQQAQGQSRFNLLNAFTFPDGAKQGGIEILGYTPDQATVAGIYVSDPDGTGPGATSFGVQVLNLGAGGSLTERFQIDLNSGNTGLTLGSVSSVTLDRAGRDFGAATVIPTDNTGTPGKVVFFNYLTGGVIGAVNVGFHPDHVRFSDDGSRLLVANEGEFKNGAAQQATGSISVIDVSDIHAGNLANLASKTALTYDFSAANLGPSASLTGIRNSNVAGVGTSGTFISAVPNFNQPANQDPAALEPEYITISGGKAYVTLQDNNAIGVFDVASGKWEKINNLGTITQTIDASDQDGGTQINDTVKGLPMPDTVASYVAGGKTYLVTANEGDARVDDRDISRFGDTSGNDSMNPILDPAVYPTTQTGVRANSALGRLNVSRLDGDNGANGGTAGDGKIDDITMIGTRSYSIWEVLSDGSLSLTYDSGSLESLLYSLDPAAHNMNRGDTGAADSRSDDKGPEPEGLAVFQSDGRTLLALGLERQNGLLLMDVSDPAAPVFFDYLNTYAGAVEDILISPEGMFHIPAADSPTGTALLLVGYEGHDGGANSSIIRGGIAVIQVDVVPEAGTMLGGGVAGLVVCLGVVRRRARRG